MIVALQQHVLELVEAGHAPGEAHGVHVVEAEVHQGPGSSGDAVALAGDIMRRLKVDFTITEKAPTTSKDNRIGWEYLTLIFSFNYV